jgi:hypothetical protein
MHEIAVLVLGNSDEVIEEKKRNTVMSKEVLHDHDTVAMLDVRKQKNLSLSPEELNRPFPNSLQ